MKKAVRKLHLPRSPVPKPTRVFRTRRNELARHAKHKGTAS